MSKASQQNTNTFIKALYKGTFLLNHPVFKRFSYQNHTITMIVKINTKLITIDVNNMVSCMWSNNADL